MAVGGNKGQLPQQISCFIDSPFTWGGIGAVIGAFLASPQGFKYAYFGSVPAIAVGLLRAGILSHKGALVRLFSNLVLCIGLIIGWMYLWKVVPKPTEPPSADQIARALANITTGKSLPSSDPSAKFADVIFQKLRQLPPANAAQPQTNAPSPLEKLARVLMAERLSTSAGGTSGRLHDIAMSLHIEIDELPMDNSRQQGMANLRRKYLNSVIAEVNQAKDCQTEALLLVPTTQADKDASALLSTIVPWNKSPAEEEYSLSELSVYFNSLQQRLKAISTF
jgi:hypothetical protein